MATTTTYSLEKPTVGGDENTWGGALNDNADKIDDLLDGTLAIKPNLDEGLWKVGGVAVTATAAELNILDGVTASTAEINILDGVTASATELNLLTGVTSLASIPSGLISLWSGSIASIPAGWLLCDGTNGTPDLRNRFVVGAGNSYAVGATGGADSVTLTSLQIPGHTHTFSGSTNTTGAHTHTINKTTDTNGGAFPTQQGTGSPNNVDLTTSSAGNHSHTFSGTTSSTGGGSSHENRPPYYALAYIMKA